MPLLDTVIRPAQATGATQPATRPLVLSTLLAVLTVAAAGLVPAVALSVLGWIIGDGSGTSMDAVRTSGVLWVTGHGGAPVVDGTTVSLVPLLVPVLLALLGVQAVRRARSTSAETGPGGQLVAVAVGAAAYAFLVGVVGWAVHNSQLRGDVDVDAPRAAGLTLLGAVLVLAAVIRPTGTSAPGLAGWPIELCAVARGAAATLVALLAGSALVLVVVLCVHADRVLQVGGELAPGPAGGTALALLCVTTLPNAVLWTASYLVGPGFAVGSGTVVAPAGVLVGPLPALPLLGALPGPGESPGWALALTVLPVLAGVVGGVLSARTATAGGWTRTALCGAGGGAGAGLALALLLALSGGAAGPGRMQDTGPLPAAAVLAVVTLTVSAGAGAVGQRLLADRYAGFDAGGLARRWPRWSRRAR